MEFFLALLIFYILYLGHQYRNKGYFAPYLTSCVLTITVLLTILFLLGSLLLDD